MLTWNFIEQSDSIGVGLTENGDTFLETTVDGWNDDVEFTDLTSLITLRAIIYDTSIDIHQTYFHPDVKSNVSAISLAKELTQELLNKAKNHR